MGDLGKPLNVFNAEHEDVRNRMLSVGILGPADFD
jgi:hypothetical protein